MSIRKMKSHKLDADAANDRAYISNIRKECGDDLADVLSEIMDTSHSGKYHMKKTEHLSPEATQLLRDLGYSVVNGYSYTGWEECRISWRSLMPGRRRYSLVRDTLVPMIIGWVIAIVIISIGELYLPMIVSLV